MYGTRGAPHVWQAMVKRVMTSLGFVMNLIHPCVFHHPERDLLVVAHVDDFLCSGDRSDLRWLRREIDKESEIKGDTIDTRPGEKTECEFLGRTIRVTEEGYEYEGNQKHARILLEEWGMDSSRSLSSPGCAQEKPNTQGRKQRSSEERVRRKHIGVQRPE